MLEGWQCPLELMDGWEEGIEHKFVIKLRPGGEDSSSRQEIAKQGRLFRQAVRKKNFVKRNNETSEDDTDTSEERENEKYVTKEVFTDNCDIFYDADNSEESDFDSSEDENFERHLKDNPAVFTSSEEIILGNHSVIIESFYT